MKNCAVLLLFAGLTACSDPPPDAAALRVSKPAVVVEQNKEYRETHYRVALGDCRIRWDVREVEPQVILQRSDCNLPLAQQVSLIAQLWKKLPATAGTRELFWGRLVPDGGCGACELSQRLVLAAHRSPEWDTGRGRPREGHANEFVRRVANEAAIYPELRALFAGEGIEISLTGVEKVLVMPAVEMPFAPALQTAGVPAEARLPYDAQIWFRLIQSSPAQARE